MTAIQDNLPNQKASEFEGLYGFSLLILLMMVLFNSHFFVVNQVTVKGNQSITSQEVLVAAHLEANQTLLQISLNLNQIHRNLLQEVRISSAQISLRFPNRVIIIIKERNPLFLLAYAKNLLVVSDDGMVLGTATGKEIKMPIVSGIILPEASIGEVIGVVKLKTALTVIHSADESIQKALRKIDLRNNLLLLDFPNCDHTIEVELGNSENIVTKMAYLRAVLTHADLNGLKKVDLRVAESPSIIKVDQPSH